MLQMPHRPIKKALHGYTHRGGDLLGSRAIYGERFGLLLKKKGGNINTEVKTKGTINYMRQTKDMWQREHVQRKKKRSEEKRHTSDLGSSSRMGWVTDESSLCLD